MLSILTLKDIFHLSLYYLKHKPLFFLDHHPFKILLFLELFFIFSYLLLPIFFFLQIPALFLLFQLQKTFQFLIHYRNLNLQVFPNKLKNYLRQVRNMLVFVYFHFIKKVFLNSNQNQNFWQPNFLIINLISRPFF